MRLREILTAGTIIRLLSLGLTALVAAGTAARGADQPVPFELRAEGSFPLKYTESWTSKSQQTSISAAPYLSLAGIARWQPDVSSAVFVEGGHDRLGGFRDSDNTFSSFGANTIKRWGALTTGASIEHTQFYSGSFGPVNNIVNDFNLFAHYAWNPNRDLSITPRVTATVRTDDSMVVQRYSYYVRFDIEQRLYGPVWFVITPRIRYSDYVNAESGRRDTTMSLLAGVRYDINDYVTFKTLAGIEDRASTVASKNIDRYFVGASIDFRVDLLHPR